MEPRKNREKRITRWRNKFRLVILNDNTFEELFTVKLSPLNIFSISVFAVITTVAFTTTVIAFTPLRELIPGYASSKIRREAISLALKTDSLETALLQNQRYLEGVQRILQGEVVDSVLDELSTTEDSLVQSLNFSDPSDQDSAFRNWVEEETEFALNAVAREIQMPQLVAPINGIVTSAFDKNSNHFAVDLAAAKNSAIKAVYEGTVIFSDWSSETGHIIIVQHENNLISAYKHNSALLKKPGDFVKSGEAIAIIGNSGENTTGPHLHFELWYEGEPIDPEDYIRF
ncbi:MAG: hypothetical protein RL754_740 [Bacteroidota bacterium]|jgi:murein DD-endopeptidase MepM/ murein hydrolase activator NlpD